MIDPLRRYGKNSWIGKPAFITGTSPGAIGSALAQQHLRAVNDRNRHDRARRQTRRTREHHRREHAEISPRLPRSFRFACRTVVAARAFAGITVSPRLRL
jgi:NAD(P)H-dependent FMN reductase